MDASPSAWFSTTRLIIPLLTTHPKTRYNSRHIYRRGGGSGEHQTIRIPTLCLSLVPAPARPTARPLPPAMLPPTDSLPVTSFSPASEKTHKATSSLPMSSPHSLPPETSWNATTSRKSRRRLGDCEGCTAGRHSFLKTKR